MKKHYFWNNLESKCVYFISSELLQKRSLVRSNNYTEFFKPQILRANIYRKIFQISHCIQLWAYLHELAVRWAALVEAALAPLVLCPLHGWLQPIMEELILAFLQVLGLSCPPECLAPRFGASGVNGAWWLDVGLVEGGSKDEFWEEQRPVGLLGGTDRSADGWCCSFGWNASPGKKKGAESWRSLQIRFL